MRGVQVLAPHDPMLVRVTALISLMSRTPSRMSLRISPAVTRSQRQTIVSSAVRSTYRPRGSAVSAGWIRMPAILLAYSRGARTLTMTVRSLALMALTAPTSTRPRALPLRVLDDDASPRPSGCP